ncbi:uncharacterized protein PFB0145c-like [Dendronephthya gigantea]|uniref:uncharacterized protein PFB0145c-like n=1 Tax=Dendronephthya gigantea TaxID=151771 RepID=UPI00106CAC3A|nr:uncharacterized protein PFB0145c-like [Dendronephthya gigantea]
MAWQSHKSSHDQIKFTVYMNEGEQHQIEEWVKKYDDIETGGDLFGAWIDEHTAVVQFVLGPGDGCRRSSVSFYQNINYLREAGGYLTQKHGLCNIGQWHSHHRLGLTRPSGGDENTVWGNMPSLGLKRYIVFIATITGGNRSYYNYSTSSYHDREDLKVNINPYVFEIKNGYRNDVPLGTIEPLPGNSPFRLDDRIQNAIKIGAESTNEVRKFPQKRQHDNKSDDEPNIPKTKAKSLQSPVDKPFTVYMNEGERHQIEKWVKKHQNIETGGDLFGAWINEHTAVVQFVLGPGVGCHRTSVSFYQDTDYLRKAGVYLTRDHGLCNIGEWHSHHTLNLTRPSGGDKNTVWGNMPSLGLNRYIMFIATITKGSRSYNYSTGTCDDVEDLKVDINPYLFEIKNGKRNDVLSGTIEALPGGSPFRLDGRIQDAVKIGAESINEDNIFQWHGIENVNDEAQNEDCSHDDNPIAGIQLDTQQEQHDGDSNETYMLSTNEEKCKKEKNKRIDEETTEPNDNSQQHMEEHFFNNDNTGHEDKTGEDAMVVDAREEDKNKLQNYQKDGAKKECVATKDPYEDGCQTPTIPRAEKEKQGDGNETNIVSTNEEEYKKEQTERIDKETTELNDNSQQHLEEENAFNNDNTGHEDETREYAMLVDVREEDKHELQNYQKDDAKKECVATKDLNEDGCQTPTIPRSEEEKQGDWNETNIVSTNEEEYKKEQTEIDKETTEPNDNSQQHLEEENAFNNDNTGHEDETREYAMLVDVREEDKHELQNYQKDDAKKECVATKDLNEDGCQTPTIPRSEEEKQGDWNETNIVSTNEEEYKKEQTEIDKETTEPNDNSQQHLEEENAFNNDNTGHEDETREYAMLVDVREEDKHELQNYQKDDAKKECVAMKDLNEYGCQTPTIPRAEGEKQGDWNETNILSAIEEEYKKEKSERIDKETQELNDNSQQHLEEENAFNNDNTGHEDKTREDAMLVDVREEDKHELQNYQKDDAKKECVATKDLNEDGCQTPTIPRAEEEKQGDWNETNIVSTNEEYKKEQTERIDKETTEPNDNSQQHLEEENAFNNDNTGHEDETREDAMLVDVREEDKHELQNYQKDDAKKECVAMKDLNEYGCQTPTIPRAEGEKQGDWNETNILSAIEEEYKKEKSERIDKETQELNDNSQQHLEEKNAFNNDNTGNEDETHEDAMLVDVREADKNELQNYQKDDAKKECVATKDLNEDGCQTPTIPRSEEEKQGDWNETNIVSTNEEEYKKEQTERIDEETTELNDNSQQHLEEENAFNNDNTGHKDETREDAMLVDVHEEDKHELQNYQKDDAKKECVATKDLNEDGCQTPTIPRAEEEKQGDWNETNIVSTNEEEYKKEQTERIDKETQELNDNSQQHLEEENAFNNDNTGHEDETREDAMLVDVCEEDKSELQNFQKGDGGKKECVATKDSNEDGCQTPTIPRAKEEKQGDWNETNILSTNEEEYKKEQTERIDEETTEQQQHLEGENIFNNDNTGNEDKTRDDVTVVDVHRKGKSELQNYQKDGAKKDPNEKGCQASTKPCAEEVKQATDKTRLLTMDDSTENDQQPNIIRIDRMADGTRFKCNKTLTSQNTKANNDKAELEGEKERIEDAIAFNSDPKTDEKRAAEESDSAVREFLDGCEDEKNSTNGQADSVLNKNIRNTTLGEASDHSPDTKHKIEEPKPESRRDLQARCDDKNEHMATVNDDSETSSIETKSNMPSSICQVNESLETTANENANKYTKPSTGYPQIAIKDSLKHGKHLNESNNRIRTIFDQIEHKEQNENGNNAPDTITKKVDPIHSAKTKIERIDLKSEGTNKPNETAKTEVESTSKELNAQTENPARETQNPIEVSRLEEPTFERSDPEKDVEVISENQNNDFSASAQTPSELQNARKKKKSISERIRESLRRKFKRTDKETKMGNKKKRKDSKFDETNKRFNEETNIEVASTFERSDPEEKERAFNRDQNDQGIENISQNDQDVNASEQSASESQNPQNPPFGRKSKDKKKKKAGCFPFKGKKRKLSL